jgi:GT2 family glycosyltransferase
MILPRETVEEMLAIASSPDSSDAYWIPEVRTGSGIRVKARNFERSFYDGTCIDALRLFSRRVLEKTGGYDENLIAGPEDWELDIRVLETGAKCAVMSHNLIHNEKKLTFRRMLEKKAYYTKSFAAYQEKWKGHPAVRRQFSPWYRFVGVFIENGKWKRLLRHPILAAAMYIERIAVGVVYLVNR